MTGCPLSEHQRLALSRANLADTIELEWYGAPVRQHHHRTEAPTPPTIPCPLSQSPNHSESREEESRAL